MPKDAGSSAVARHQLLLGLPSSIHAPTLNGLDTYSSLDLRVWVRLNRVVADGFIANHQHQCAEAERVHASMNDSIGFYGSMKCPCVMS